ncbi:beta-ketoacyl-[acyl-carrier-protein] synthase family protein [Streptomyces sp. NPDC000618]|uniref:beta-ketoacyl-[acyl-carrier-protein] synthase family protein n=2 Tax=unclassified Streptomyces TaxID=2593676 RepID=UPI003320480D
MMTNRRVVVTGLGCVTPIGEDVPSTWRAMLDGRSGVRRLDDGYSQNLPVKIAAPVVAEPPHAVERVKGRRMDRNAQFAVAAAREAWADAELTDDLPKERLGVVVGCAVGGLHTTLSNYDHLPGNPRRVSPWGIPMLMVNSAAAYVGIEFEARSAVRTPVSACASGNEALAMAADEIRLGRADVVLAGGAESAITPLTLAAFAQMTALSTRNDAPTLASRPWDLDRDGFVLGEGAGILVLEAYDHARARGANIYAELSGAGVTSDGYDIVRPDPDAKGAFRAMRQALEDGYLVPEDIVHVNAHATSTPMGDVIEASAVRRVLGKAADGMIATASKSMTGHLLGASGAVESIATVLAIRDRLVPPTVNLERPDPRIDLDMARTERKLPGGDVAALCNSFGFGGHNTSIAFASI